ncbi:hypothetical protein, partial [Mycobacterium sp.]|uniref:hypothetical protein n=1 Tax=Mycobacterium sp. TaxID=1785 RepID=UPI003BB7B47A
MTWSRPLKTYPARATRSKALFLEGAVLGDLYRCVRHVASLTGSESGEVHGFYRDPVVGCGSSWASERASDAAR